MTDDPINDALGGASEAEPEGPRPLTREASPPQPFPIAALGPVLGPAVQAIQDTTQAPVELCAQSVLAAASYATQPHANIALPTGAVEGHPLSCFFLSIAASGERKTSADRLALEFVDTYERWLKDDHDQEITRHEVDKATYEEERRQILKDKKKYGSKDHRKQALADLGESPLPPLIPILLMVEPTFEGLIRLLREGRASIGLFSNEGGQFFGGYGMSDDNILKTSAGLSAAWDGQAIKRTRAGDGNFALYGRRVALHLMTQPRIGQEVLSNEMLRDQGLLSRFLVAAPPSTAGLRLWREPAPGTVDAIAQFNHAMGRILRAPWPLKEGQRNELKPRRLELSDEARGAWVTFHDHVEVQLGDGGSLAVVRGFGSKLAEHAGRLAGVVALAEGVGCVEVEGRHMGQGIALANYYASEALRLTETGMTDPELLKAQKLLEWLLDGWVEEAVSLPDIYQFGPSFVRSQKVAKRLVSVLEAHGWLHHLEGGSVINGLVRKEAWSVIRGDV